MVTKKARREGVAAKRAVFLENEKQIGMRALSRERNKQGSGFGGAKPTEVILDELESKPNAAG